MIRVWSGAIPGTVPLNRTVRGAGVGLTGASTIWVGTVQPNRHFAPGSKPRREKRSPVDYPQTRTMGSAVLRGANLQVRGLLKRQAGHFLRETG